MQVFVEPVHSAGALLAAQQLCRAAGCGNGARAPRHPAGDRPALAPAWILPCIVVLLLHLRSAAQVVASSAAGKRGCADLNGHFGHLLTSSPAAAVPAQAPRAAPQKLAAAATMLQRLLGKRVATDTGSNLAQTSSWQVRPLTCRAASWIRLCLPYCHASQSTDHHPLQALYAAAALVKRQRCLAAQQPP